jgi:hypothetical protein
MLAQAEPLIGTLLTAAIMSPKTATPNIPTTSVSGPLPAYRTYHGLAPYEYRGGYAGGLG